MDCLWRSLTLTKIDQLTFRGGYGDFLTAIITPPNNLVSEVSEMRWSEILLRKFNEKYLPILKTIGWETEVTERVIPHVGGRERNITIAIFRNGHITVRYFVISEVVSREGHWVRIASTYNSMGVVAKSGEQIWKGFYSQLNKIVSSCVLDMLHEVGVNGTVRFSLRDGLEVKMPNTEVKIPTDQINEISRIIALSNL
jgi:hypothetical protein